MRKEAVVGLDPERFKTICIYLTKSSNVPNFFEEKGLKVFYLSRNKSLRILSPTIICKLVKILKTEHVDVLHCHRHKLAVYGTIAIAFAKTPVLITHVEGLHRTRNIKRKLANSFVYRRVDKVLTVADGVKEDVLKNNPGLSPDKVFTLGNSIDFKKFAEVTVTKKQIREKENLPVDSFIFGTVGRLAPTKGQKYLLEAFAKVKSKMPNSHLIIIGDGRLHDDLQKQVLETGLGGSVHFLGRREDIPELLKAMDCFVLPSIAEGLPGAVLEAMAAGVPCIASAVGGIPEVITDAKTGFLVPAYSEQALAESMEAVAKMPQQQIAEIVGKAKELIQTAYTHEVIRGKLEHLYETEFLASPRVHS